VQKEIKTTKEKIEKKKRKLEELRSERDCLAESGEYAMNRTLSNNGLDRNVYHSKCQISPHIQKLLDRQVKVLDELKTKFVAVRDQTLEKHHGANCATNQAIVEEMAFFSKGLQFYHISFALLRQTRTMSTVK
jgi:hypothetical protein